jgi:hypothetical protein
MALPKKPTPEQIKKLEANYKELREEVSRVGELVLKMARHPDATDAEVLEAALGYRKHHASLRKIRESCRQLPVPYRSVGYQWEKPL